MRTLIIGLALLMPLTAFAEWEVVRVYQSSSAYMRAVVTGPAESVRMKCALLDSEGVPISVGEHMVTGPHDDVMIRIPPGARAQSVSCSYVRYGQ